MDFAEAAVEVGEIGETGIEGDLADAQIGSNELSTGVTDPKLVDEIEKAPSGGALEKPAERAGAERAAERAASSRRISS